MKIEKIMIKYSRVENVDVHTDLKLNHMKFFFYVINCLYQFKNNILVMLVRTQTHKVSDLRLLFVALMCVQRSYYVIKVFISLRN